MLNTIQPLVLTPKYQPNESLLGYVLRLSEENGYDTPWYVLSHAGISRREALSPLFPTDRLAAVLGKDHSHLLPIAYSNRTKDSSLCFRILAHDLGQSPRMRTYRLAYPAFCIECVKDKGYLEAHWDLDLVTTCPQHSCELFTSCPVCNKAVGWFRQGLLQCECGQDWTNIMSLPADPTISALQNILIAKILNQPVTMSGEFCLPVKQLYELSLSSLLAAIETIGKCAANIDNLDCCNRKDLVRNAAHVFINWPTNYEQFIDRLTCGGGSRSLKLLLTSLRRAGIADDRCPFLCDPIKDRLAALSPINIRAMNNKYDPLNHSPALNSL